MRFAHSKLKLFQSYNRTIWSIFIKHLSLEKCILDVFNFFYKNLKYASPNLKSRLTTLCVGNDSFTGRYLPGASDVWSYKTITNTTLVPEVKSIDTNTPKVAISDTIVAKLKSQRDYLWHLVTRVRCTLRPQHF